MKAIIKIFANIIVTVCIASTVGILMDYKSALERSMQFREIEKENLTVEYFETYPLEKWLEEDIEKDGLYYDASQKIIAIAQFMIFVLFIYNAKTYINAGREVARKKRERGQSEVTPV